jgi:hypothetical protein
MELIAAAVARMARQRQGNEPATRPQRKFLVDLAELLAREIHHRWNLDTTRCREGTVNERAITGSVVGKPEVTFHLTDER